MPVDMSGYVDVAERIRIFRDEYPDGSLRPANPERPYTIETIGDRTFIVYIAAAYRDQDDRKPGIGVAWEPFPGKTNFTRDSELQNAETSAWGRAIVASLAADTRHGIASSQEVQARNGSTGPHDRKRTVVMALNKLKLPTAGTLEELEARLAAAGPASGDAVRDDGSGVTEPPSAPDPLPPATEEERIASGPCQLCLSTHSKRVLTAGGKVVCADARGCKERQETNAADESPFV